MQANPGVRGFAIMLRTLRAKLSGNFSAESLGFERNVTLSLSIRKGNKPNQNKNGTS